MIIGLCVVMENAGVEKFSLEGFIASNREGFKTRLRNSIIQGKTEESKPTKEANRKRLDKEQKP